MTVKSIELQNLMRIAAHHINPQAMTLTEIDRLYTATTKTIATRPVSVDLFTLDLLAKKLDTVRRERRLARTGHAAGQLDIHGDELAA